RLAAEYRKTNDRVAIVAVDPSSPFTGGAILGDRIRMRDRFLDEGIFIRSMASRGHAGGLARATMRVVNVLDALGTGLVIVETVGVGEEEVDVVRVADTVCLVTVPGLGDDIQAIKAGVLEIADVLVVNKADKPGADETARDLAQMLSLGPSGRPGPASPAADEPHSRWKPPIIRTSAQDGGGIDELVRAIDAHADWARANGELERRRADRVRAAFDALFPGSAETPRAFGPVYVELQSRRETTVGPATITAIGVEHTAGTNAHGLRIELGGRTVGYSGDTAWTDALLEIASRTDAFICECLALS